MADPTPPAKFTAPEDVSARWILGEWTSGDIQWDDWAQERIIDVESILIGLVPSLDVPVDQIDPRRLRNVKALVADKVIELRANPRGVTSGNQTMGPFAANEQYRATTTSQAVWFSEQELDSVRLVNKRRRFGTIPLGPGLYAPSGRWQPWR